MPATSPHLAVVDDDADVRIALVRLLSSARFAVDGFATGTEFLLAIEHHPPDCVVLDLHMPGMNGFEVQGALTRGGRRIPVVMITGHDTAESRQRALELGASAYLAKPVDHEALLTAVEDAMRGCGARP